MTVDEYIAARMTDHAATLGLTLDLRQSNHEGHLIDANERDRPFVTPELLTAFGYVRDAAGWHAHLDALARGGATEVAYQPAGPDIPGELERFAAMFRSR